MLGVGFVGFVKSPYAAIALLSLGGFAHQTLSVTVITMASDLFRKNEVATAAGMAGTLRQRGPAHLLPADRRPGRHRRLHAVLHLPGRARPGRRCRPLVLVRERTLERLTCPTNLANPQSDSAGLQSRPFDRPRRRRLLHRHLDLRVVPRRADPPLARSGPLAPADPPAHPRQPAQHARRPGFLRHLGALPQLLRRPVLPDLHRRQTLRTHHAGRQHRRVLARHAQLPGDQSRASTASGPIPIYLNSSGFDPSLFHDDDGRKYLLNMLWDHRPGHNRFAGIVLQEYSPARNAS